MCLEREGGGGQKIFLSSTVELEMFSGTTEGILTPSPGGDLPQMLLLSCHQLFHLLV